MDEKKLEVMKMVVDGEKSISWAAAKLKRSEKTIRRYRKELLENPNADLVHKNRGREPANKTDHELIWHLYCTRYYGLNITYFCEKLEENESIKISDYTQSGRVKTVKFGNTEIAGTKVRSLLELKSTNFAIKLEGDNIIFSVKGYGHGVGMSQTGADSMAKNGSTCEEILKHFYTGVEITQI